MLEAPAIPVSIAEQVVVNRDLVDLPGGAAAATVLYSAKAMSPAAIAQVSRPAAPDISFDVVFFDPHSGVRYLVKSGQIVKPLEAVDDTALGDKGGNEATKSVYFGSREK
jgi:hypothetical protein